MTKHIYDVPDQPGDDKDRGRAPIIAIFIGFLLVAMLVAAWWIF